MRLGSSLKDLTLPSYLEGRIILEEEPDHGGGDQQSLEQEEEPDNDVVDQEQDNDEGDQQTSEQGEDNIGDQQEEDVIGDQQEEDDTLPIATGSNAMSSHSSTSLMYLTGKKEQLSMAKSIEGMVDSEPDEEDTVSMKVQEWISEPEFDPETIGTYVFTPVLDETWSLADGVELPIIAVQVEETVMMSLGITDLDITVADVKITENGSYIISGSGMLTTNTITVNPGVEADITLDGVNINVEDDPMVCALDMSKAGTCTITLAEDSENILKSGEGCPGIYTPNGKLLTITGKGSLEACGGKNWPGIGGFGNGNIEIQDGEITAIGGNNAAGIGGSSGTPGGNITISGGTVTAISKDVGAGIGGGDGGAGGNITISGGTVTAISKDGGAGIGGGVKCDSVDNITISGGTVTATSNNGAGIGSGAFGWNSVVNITINGGTVTADSNGGAGIGTGLEGGSAIITISGGTVTAKKRGVGCGVNTEDCDLTIIGGSVNASFSKADPKDGNGEKVFLGKLLEQSRVTSVSVDGFPFWINNNHDDDSALYLYMTGEKDHNVKVEIDGVVTWHKAKWNGTDGFSWGDGVTVVDTSVSLSLSPNLAVYKSGNVKVNVTITDHNIEITGDKGECKLYVNGSLITNNDGLIEHNISNLNIGNHEFKAEYSGAPASNSSSVTEILYICDKPTVGTITITDPVRAGEKLNLTVPTINDNNDTVTEQGGEISSDGNTGWTEFDPESEMTLSHSGQYLRYYATNRAGTGYSNIVQITIAVGNSDGSGSSSSGGFVSSKRGGSESSIPETPGQWQQTENGWNFRKPDGGLYQNTWIFVKGKWYWIESDGIMAQGWKELNGKKYYLMPVQGEMLIGWFLDGQNWYYTNADGVMQVGWVNVGGKWYYLAEDGHMLSDTTTPDGYHIDENGAWIQ